MSDRGFLERLLDGANVVWVPLGDVTKIKTGQSVTEPPPTKVRGFSGS